MATKTARISPNEQVPLIIADWRTGAFTQRDLAYKHKVSVGFVNKTTKDIPKDTEATVNKLVEAKQELSALDEHSVNSVNAIVDERTKHIQFFNSAAITNVSIAVKKIGVESSQMEHRMLAETILKGKETVLGKAADTAIQINNNNPQPVTRIERVIIDAHDGKIVEY